METKPQKAWQVDFRQIENGWEYSERVVYADTRNQAKTLLLKEAWDMILKDTGDDVTYLTIPVVRAKEYDKILFEDNYYTRGKIEQIKYDRSRILELDAILNNANITHCYIKKGGYYYQPNSSGYTDYVLKAGVYTKEDAVSSAKSCNELSIIPINIIEHNDMMQNEINKLT